MEDKKYCPYFHAALGLVLAEQYGQRPEAVEMTVEEKIKFKVKKHFRGNWATPKQQYHYLVGWELIPSITVKMSKSTTQILQESWQDLFEKYFVTTKTIVQSSSDWQEMFVVANQIISFFKKHQDSCLKIASILFATNKLEQKQIEEVLERFDLVFDGGVTHMGHNYCNYCIPWNSKDW